MDKYLEFYWMNEDIVCSRVRVYFGKGIFRCDNYNVHHLFWFYDFPEGSLESLYDLLEERCYDRNRVDIKEILRMFGLTQYDPLEMCKITNGRLYTDKFWIDWIYK